MTRILFGPLFALVFVLNPVALSSPRPAAKTILKLLITTPPPPPFLAASFPLSDVTERLMSFDSNKDHLVSRDELPERMKGLIGRGDRNADAALDLTEMGPLVNTEAPKRTHVFSRPQPSDSLAGVISDLKLSAAKHERALAILNAYKGTHNGNNPTRSNLYAEMRSLLDHEEYRNFVAAVARLDRRLREIVRHLQ